MENYKQSEVVDAIKISSPEINQPLAQNDKSEEIERTRKARLKFFEKAGFTSNSATMITNQQQKNNNMC